jgi:hypothetical protein
MLSFESVDHAFAQMVESARRASSELSCAGIPHRIVGDVAVFLHVDAVEPVAARLTPDVDIAILSDGFAGAARVLESLGYVSNESSFRDPVSPRVWHAIHLGSESIPASEPIARKKAFSSPLWPALSAGSSPASG